MCALTLKSSAVLAACGCIAWCSPSFGQDAPQKAESFEAVPADAGHAESDTLGEERDEFRVKLYLWAWLTGYYGDVGVKGTVSEVSSSFSDILEQTDSVFAFSGRVEVGFGKFGAYFDGLYTEAKVNDVKGPDGLANIDIDLEQTIMDFGLTYRLGDWLPEGSAAENSNDMTLDLYAGGRYNGIELTLNPLNEPARSGDQHWVDPVIGLKFVAPLSRSWHAELNGDIGGFGVESDFAWSATAVLGYDFTMFNAPSSFLFGVRAYGWDYSDGSGEDEFTWDVVQVGLLFGLSIRF